MSIVLNNGGQCTAAEGVHIYIYIYIYMCVCACGVGFQHTVSPETLCWALKTEPKEPLPSSCRTTK